MRGSEFFKAALILAGAYTSSYITGGKIPYSVFYMAVSILSVDLIWSLLGTLTTGSSWVETRTVQAGTKVKVFTEVKNNSRWPVPWVQCWIEMPGTFGLPENMCCYNFSLGPYETKVVTEEMECKMRGKFRWGECFIRTGGLLGFFTKTRKGGYGREIEVIPKFFDISGFGTENSRGSGKLTGLPLRAQESTGQFSIRNYTSNDGMSRIHWKISAKSGHLMVKENQQVNTTNYHLILDNCTENHIGDGPDASFEKAVSLAASIAISASRTGSVINLTVYRPDASNTLNTCVKNGRGKSYLAAITKCLTTVELQDSTVGEAEYIELLRGSDSGLILITGNLHDKIVQTIIRKKAYGRNSIVFLLELETFGRAKIDRAERQNAVYRLRGLGIKVISINKDTDLRLMMGRSVYGIS